MITNGIGHRTKHRLPVNRVRKNPRLGFCDYFFFCLANFVGDSSPNVLPKHTVLHRSGQHTNIDFDTACVYHPVKVAKMLIL